MALLRLGVEDKANWGIKDLFTSRPLDFDTSVAMNSINCKFWVEVLSPVKTVKAVKNMALAAADNDSGASETQLEALTLQLESEKSNPLIPSIP